MSRAEIFFITGRWEEAAKVYYRNREILAGTGCLREWSENTARLARVYGYLGETEQALSLAYQAEQGYQEADDSEGLCRISGYRGTFHLLRSEYDRALSCQEKALSIARKIGDRIAESDAQGNIGNIYWQMGSLDQALERYESQYQISSRLDERLGLGRCCNNRGIIFYLKGDYQRALDLFMESRKAFEEIGNRADLCQPLGNAGTIYWQTGHYHQAGELYRLQEENARLLGDRLSQAIAWFNLGCLCWDLGEVTSSLDYLARARRQYQQLQNKYYLCEAAYKEAQFRIALNELDAARALLDEYGHVGVQLDDNGFKFMDEFLRHKLTAITDPVEAVAGFRQMLNRWPDDEDQAQLHFELFKLGDGGGHREVAMELLSKLIERAPKREYIRKLEELRHKREEGGKA